MGLLDKRAGDWTARDVVSVWSMTWIVDLFKVLLVFPLFFSRPSAPPRSQKEIQQGMKDYGKRLRREQLYRDLGIDP